jgi:ribosomal-protein-alanine N-acetyltransferase
MKRSILRVSRRAIYCGGFLSGCRDGQKRLRLVSQRTLFQAKIKSKMNHKVKLRKTEKSDLELLFQFQLDKEANYLAAFTSKDPTDKDAYFEKFTKILNDPTINNQTILVDETIVGSIAKFEIKGDPGITYWIDKNFWGKGIATTALENFLSIESTRPIWGRVAFDNLGSQKVLEKCGFVKIGTDKGFANARQKEIAEFIYKLT